jgi:hypothetical protein
VLRHAHVLGAEEREAGVGDDDVGVGEIGPGALGGVFQEIVDPLEEVVVGERDVLWEAGGERVQEGRAARRLIASRVLLKLVVVRGKGAGAEGLDQGFAQGGDELAELHVGEVATSRAARTADSRAPSIQACFSDVCSPAKWTGPSTDGMSRWNWVSCQGVNTAASPKA